MSSLPIEKFDLLLDECNRGAISEDEAIRRLRALPPLSAADAETAADRVKEPPLLRSEPEMVLLRDMDIGRPVLFSTLEDRRHHFLLIHESIRPRDGSSLGSHRAVRDCLTATIDLLTERHDPAAMDKAVRLAEKYVGEAGSAQALNLAGRVHFEPHSLCPGSRSYEYDVTMRNFRRAWAVGAPRPFDPDLMHGNVPNMRALPGFGRFPGHNESLDRAASYFRLAAENDNGMERGRALAYLALLDLTRALSHRSLNTQHVQGLLDEADRLLPRREDPTIWARLWPFAGELEDYSVLTRNRVPVRNAGLMVAEHGLQSTAWLYLWALDLVLGDRSGPETETIALRLEPFLPRTGMEAARLHLRSRALHSLPEDPTGCEHHLMGRPAQTLLDQGHTTAAIHALAHATTYDRRTTQQVENAVGNRNGPLQDALRLARAVSFDPIGPLRGQDVVPLELAIAATDYLMEDCPDTATLCLVALAQHIARSTSETQADLAFLLVRLSGLVGGAGVLLPDQGHRALRDTLFQVTALAALHDTAFRDTAWLAVHQLAKGYVLASALGRNRRTQDRTTVHVSQALRVRGTTGWDLPVRFWQVGGSGEAQLAAPFTFREARPGINDAEVSANWRRVYHRTIARDIARAGLANNAPMHGLDEVSTVLGDSACLLSLLTGNLERRGYGNVITAELITSLATKVVIIGSPDSTGVEGMMLGDAERGMIELSVAFSGVPHLLAALQEDPLTRDVSRQAETRLNEEAEGLAPVLRWLAELDPGVTTLYLWPHEAAHVLPFWLLPLGDGIVADRFTVSVLPFLEPFFMPVRENSTAKKSGVLAIASAAGGLRYGLSREESVEDSANQIAAMFGCEALTGEQATPENFLARAGSTQYIHVAAHGIHDPDAPMFHCLFLNGDDGKLFADQILQCDLRAVRLVTIEACESMLVRYDYLDTVIGLPTFILRAGAGAVIGASWLVRPEISALFFITLYRHLHDSESIGTAFSKAQQRTRNSYPQYTDWGAFCLMGYAG